MGNPLIYPSSHTHPASGVIISLVSLAFNNSTMYACTHSLYANELLVSFESLVCLLCFHDP